MSKNDKREIKSVSRSMEPDFPIVPIVQHIWTTKIKDKEGETYSGSGGSKEEADKRAGERFEDNKPDSSRSSGGVCFVSTACVMSRELPDDCLELQVLRRFRDTFVKGLPNGQQAVSEYYAVASPIVRAIDKRPDRIEIYGSLFEKLVKRSIVLIQKGRSEEAFRNYQQVVNDLRGRYL